MIELIINGALPKPAKCLSCGYSGNDRWYFRFNSFIPRLGQVLLCVAKYPGDSNTGCFNEAARRFNLSFMDRRDVEQIMEDNDRLRKENDNLEFAAERFTDNFADLINHFLNDIKEGKSGQNKSDSDRPPAKTSKDGSQLELIRVD